MLMSPGFAPGLFMRASIDSLGMWLNVTHGWSNWLSSQRLTLMQNTAGQAGRVCRAGALSKTRVVNQAELAGLILLNRWVPVKQDEFAFFLGPRDARFLPRTAGIA